MRYDQLTLQLFFIADVPRNNHYLPVSLNNSMVMWGHKIIKELIEYSFGIRGKTITRRKWQEWPNKRSPNFVHYQHVLPWLKTLKVTGYDILIDCYYRVNSDGQAEVITTVNHTKPSTVLSFGELI